jgi:Cu(I)/Ag(I) efflux system membrane fusion protein
LNAETQSTTTSDGPSGPVSAEGPSPRRAGLWARATIAALLAVLLALVVQHFRHGWPFSLHHGYDPDDSTAGAASIDHTGREPHPRAAVTVSAEQAAQFGIRVEPARIETVARTIRAVATIVPDESRISHVHTRVAGWIDKLYVRTTGEPVRAGAPLAQIFSQELLASQNEFLALREAVGSGKTSPLLEAARERLSVQGMSSKQIDALAKRGHADRYVTVHAPRTGVVLTRGITVGTAVDPTTQLMTVADLSRVWAFAEIPEGDIPDIELGSVAELSFAAAGELELAAPVVFVYPTLSEGTRTLRVRFELDNPDGTLRPGIYGTATFHTEPREALTVPRDAVVDTGIAQHVFVHESDGRFVPRKVVLGVGIDDRVEVREGVEAGEHIVTSGVFLIDSESRLRATGGAGGHAHGSNAGSTPASPSPEPPAAEHAGHAGHEG